MNKRNIIVTEIDGVISDDRWRKTFLDESWEEYYKPMNIDSPFEDTVTLLRSMAILDHELLVLTSRPEKYRQMTMSWLHHRALEPDHLIMRPDICFEKVVPLKLQQLEMEIGKDFPDHILAFIENNTNLLEAMRGLNVTTIEIMHRART